MKTQTYELKLKNRRINHVEENLDSRYDKNIIPKWSMRRCQNLIKREKLKLYRPEHLLPSQ